MKKKIPFQVFLFACTIILSGEPVFIVPDGNSKAVIGLKYENGNIAPIVVNYNRLRHPGEAPSQEYTYYSNNRIHIETSIPSVLFGDNKDGLTQLNGILNIRGDDTFIPELMYFEWLNTRFLGSVFAKSYPILYVHRLGWIYLKEEIPGIYYMYSYYFGDWFYLDLHSIWNKKLIPPLPEPIFPEP